MVAVSYYCPRCGAVAELDRDAYLADKSVTPFPLAGWTYATPSDDYEADEWDGVALSCGDADHDGLDWTHPPHEADSHDDTPGCGEAVYLNFVRFEDGQEVDGTQESQPVTLADSLEPTRPRGPTGPGFSR
ncbi:hypothetical protein PNQ29_05175 [Halobacterium salinarum]|uniref:hypothetical protein n=1 Tax=Halobacterium salinarum TaxID=2242 RepID=UPI0025549006|nr:hypothetical protein [Halobacterium salinarum]MDL0119127.1 hypothetical protein [Halobacterium salinarum]